MIRIFVAFALSAACFAADQSPTLRLDTDVRPVNYAADLTLSPRELIFTGHVDIDVELAHPSSLIWLNGMDLDITKATAGAQTAEIVKGNPGFIGVRVKTPLPAGRAKLHFEYSGKVDPQSTSGLFQGKDAGNLYLFSQFETTDARRAFPCFDQPEFKTPWKLTLHVPKEDAAFANTPQVSSTDEADGRKRVEFAPSKPLPSYLVALAVGPFEVVDAGRAGKAKFPVRIITPKGKANQAKYAAEVTATVLDRLEAYFGVPYPYEKSDSVDVPLTFGFEAMENAGLVTYAENTLLSDPATDSIARQRRYASDAAHELGHQWFGDLVTPVWWDDIWLNESFATWISSKVMAEWHPEWNTRLTDLAQKFAAMAEDGLASTRRIRQPIESDSDIASAFDQITYLKGSAVIRMFESWVGEKQFQAGVKSYMQRYSFKTARLSDFLDSIANTGQPRLTKAFTTFLDQPGYPEVSVKVECDGGPRVRLTQKRYKPAGSASEPEQWQVPVCVRYPTASGPKSECFLLDKSEADFKLTKATSCPAYVSANNDATGYYATTYPDAMLDEFVKPTNTFLTATEKATLLQDLNSLASSGGVKESKALETAAAFANARERQIASRAATVVAQARTLVPVDLQANYARFVQKSFGARAARLGWTAKPGEDPETKLDRASIVPFVARYGDSQELRQEARRLAEEWLKTKRGIDPNLLTGVLTTAAYFGDRALYDQLLAALLTNRDQQQRAPIISALGAFRDPAIVADSMALVMDPRIDPRESLGLLFAPANEPTTQRMPFEFVKAHYDELLKRLPTGAGFDAGSLLPFSGGGSCDAKSRAELSDYFKDKAKQFAGGQHNFDEVMEGARLCEAQKELKGADVAAFFAKQ